IKVQDSGLFAPLALSKLARSSSMLATILSLAILSASACDLLTWSAICFVWLIAASNALRANSLCLAKICCGSPLGLKLRAISRASRNADSIISFCFAANVFIPSEATRAVCVRASKFLRWVSTSLSTSTFGSPRSDANCLTISTNDCDSFVMPSSRLGQRFAPVSAVRHAALVQPQTVLGCIETKASQPADEGSVEADILQVPANIQLDYIDHLCDVPRSDLSRDESRNL